MSRLLDLMFGLTGNPSTKDVTAQNTPDATDDTKKLATTDWAKFGFAISKTTNGYIKLPTWMGGLIVQWGHADDLVTFPIPFPNAVLSVQLTPIATQEESTAAMSAWVRAYTNTSLDINRSVANFFVFWIAVGH